jgi:hypothetical protein
VVPGLPQEMRQNIESLRAFPGKVVPGLPQEIRQNIESLRAFPGKVVLGLPQEMRQKYRISSSISRQSGSRFAAGNATKI